MDTRNCQVCGSWGVCSQLWVLTGKLCSGICLHARDAAEALSQRLHSVHSVSNFVQVFELQDNTLQKVQELEKPARFKCGTFGASSMSERQLATGSFQGQLQVASTSMSILALESTVAVWGHGCLLCMQMWDLEHTREPVYTAEAHASIINQIDGTGGQASCSATSISLQLQG